MFNFAKKSHVSIELNDYAVRGLVKKGPNSDQLQPFEFPLPAGVIENATIVDEMALFELLKENVNALGGKRQNISMFVPDTSVLLKSFEHGDDVKSEKLLEYVQMELGRSIHLPFQEPLVDVYDHVEDDGKAVIFAAPPEEVLKVSGILQDLDFNPQAADIRALCNLRFLQHIEKIDEEKTYLVADWSINEVSICIFSAGQVEFLRFQSLDTDLNNWQLVELTAGNEFEYVGNEEDYQMQIADQVLEIDRMMNFFRFSLHKGEKAVDTVIIMGDNPYLTNIATTVATNISVEVEVIDDQEVQQVYKHLNAKFAALIGLSLKEVKE